VNIWQGKHILVIGAARQGQAVSRYLAAQGAFVTLNDGKPKEEIQLHGELLNSNKVEKVFNGHPLRLLDNTDVVCISGGVPLTLPLISAAAQRGIPLTNDSQIFMHAVNATTIGITGSAGKTTTTTLVGSVAKLNETENIKAWVGGNIGNPLIESVSEIRSEDFVILELSSFQLELMDVSPNIACVLNITPNHLDRHGNMQSYISAKTRIIAYQNSQDTVVLNRDDSGSMGLRPKAKGTLWTFGFNQIKDDQSVFVSKNSIFAQFNNQVQEIMPLSILKLIGQHNVANAMATCAICLAAGFSKYSISKGIGQISGVSHRLELVREINGVRWINDSIATAPERTMAALRAIPESVVLLLGGRDKNLPWAKLAAELHERKIKVIAFGEAADLIQDAIEKIEGGKPEYPFVKAGKMLEALDIAAKIAIRGDTVLLSPGGTSFDEFKDFEERGEVFRDKVNTL